MSVYFSSVDRLHLGGTDFADLELRGTRMAYQNVELRFPLLPFLPIQYDFLTGLVFFDAATAWGIQGFDQFTGEAVNRKFKRDNILTSYGVGFRFNLGGLLVLRWDFPLKKESAKAFVRNEPPSTHFSIGLDF